VGLVGNDDQGKALRRIFTEAGIDTSGVLIDRDRPTVTKTRISGHARQSVTQQIVRNRSQIRSASQSDIQAQLAEFITAKLPEVDAVVCSDYGEGVMMPIVIAAALQHPISSSGCPKSLDRYQGATIFTPNLPEAELAAGFAISDGSESLDRAAAKLLEASRRRSIC
jgi:bifunctional ADP-heptose synthase (sugar kinase/adenylyltransferase)